MELMKWLTPKVDKSTFAVSSAPTFYGRSESRGAGGSNSSTGTAQGEFYSAPVARAADRNGLQVGMNVHHAKFGSGMIMNLEGSGTDARVQVNFKHAGVKWLATSIAKLEVI
jgi:DNA helicase-2/ATP-dependent DNA helicase PcrA